MAIEGVVDTSVVEMTVVGGAAGKTSLGAPRDLNGILRWGISSLLSERRRLLRLCSWPMIVDARTRFDRRALPASRDCERSGGVSSLDRKVGRLNDDLEPATMVCDVLYCS